MSVVVLYHARNSSTPEVSMTCADFEEMYNPKTASVLQIKQHNRCMDMEYAQQMAGERAWLYLGVFVVIIAFIALMVWDSKRKH